MKKWISIVAGLAIVATGGLVARNSLNSSAAAVPEGAESPFVVSSDSIVVPDEAARQIGLETLAVEPRAEPVTLRLTGRTGLDMERVAHVKVQFPGRIVDVGPQLGAPVDGPDAAGGKPTTLCVIESVDLANSKSAYLKAKVQFELDTDTLRRTDELVATKVLAEKFHLDAATAVAKDEADLRAARQNLLVFGLDDGAIAQIEKQEGRERMAYEIQSPCSGTIAEKNVTRGELADTSVNLFTIADTRRLWIWGDVYERDWQRVKLGQRMRVTLAALPGVTLETSIDFVSPVVDGAARVVRIRGVLDNGDQKLLAEMFGTILVTLDEGQGALVIPAEAVVHHGLCNSVFVLHGQDERAGTSTYACRAVTVESLEGGRVRVTSGLAAGDLVVARGALGLWNEMQ